MTVAPVSTSRLPRAWLRCTAHRSGPGGYGPANVLDDVGHLARHRAPGRRCFSHGRVLPVWRGMRWRSCPVVLDANGRGRCRKRARVRSCGLSGRRWVTPLSTGILLALGLALLWPRTARSNTGNVGEIARVDRCDPRGQWRARAPGGWIGTVTRKKEPVQSCTAHGVLRKRMRLPKRWPGR